MVETARRRQQHGRYLEPGAEEETMSLSRRRQRLGCDLDSGFATNVAICGFADPIFCDLRIHFFRGGGGGMGDFNTSANL